MVLGPTGRNFAAGMSGGKAFVLDGTTDFRKGRYDGSLVSVEPVFQSEDKEFLWSMIESHHRFTDSEVAGWILENWEEALTQFVLVIPHEYRAALERSSKESAPPRVRMGVTP